MGLPTEVMSPKEFKEKMNEYSSTSRLDIEDAHGKMDDLMCGLLVDLGYGEGVEIFHNQKKWYS